MATPFPNICEADSKDAYNFYHSQLRINIECAFGILVNRFGILRSAMTNFRIKKICELVTCLCQLHNFLIEQTDIYISEQSIDETSLLRRNRNGTNQYVTVRTFNNDNGEINYHVDELIGNEHFDDDNGGEIRRFLRTQTNNEQNLPREILHNQICENAMMRPT